MAQIKTKPLAVTPPADPTPKQVFLQLQLPDHVFQAYMKEAEDSNKSLGQVITETIIKARESVGRTAFFTTPEERKELDNLAGRNVLNANDLVTIMRRMVSLRIDGIEVPVEPTLLARLQSRSHVNSNWAEFIRDTVKHQLAQFAGLA